MAPRGCTEAASKEDMVEVVVCTKPGGKEALAQGKFTQAGNKAVMVEGKYTHAGNSPGMDAAGAETIIDMA